MVKTEPGSYDTFVAGLDPAGVNRALNWAITQRNFEVELYWKRATYFWTIVAVAFAGYFALIEDEKSGTPTNAFIVSCVGGVFTVAWYWASRAASYWHVVWDVQVKELGRRAGGAMFGASLEKTGPWGLGPYRVSVAGLNEILALYVFFVWLGLACRALSEYYGIDEPWRGFNIHAFGGLTALFVVVLQPAVLERFRRRLVVTLRED